MYSILWDFIKGRHLIGNTIDQGNRSNKQFLKLVEFQPRDLGQIRKRLCPPDEGWEVVQNYRPGGRTGLEV